jgi:hypothetical protein
MPGGDPGASECGIVDETDLAEAAQHSLGDVFWNVTAT